MLMFEVADFSIFQNRDFRDLIYEAYMFFLKHFYCGNAGSMEYNKLWFLMDVGAKLWFLMKLHSFNRFFQKRSLRMLGPSPTPPDPLKKLNTSKMFIFCRGPRGR